MRLITLGAARSWCFFLLSSIVLLSFFVSSVKSPQSPVNMGLCRMTDCDCSVKPPNRRTVAFSKSPALRGLLGGLRRACDCGPLSVLFIERQTGKSLKRGHGRRENPFPKAQFPIAGAGFTGAFSYIAHKRRNALLQRAVAGTHRPSPNRAHSAHRAKHGGFQGRW